ncbi:TetR/AcrR family transcriptional regulator [Paenibacillus sp. HW567]|uniref:TetR/AcrR family transcriptional regulator n=1 Tax=Paenibacillus sp. HW567 TaxID=1034769 RepID=UPI00037331AB|nr:TetR/AcrR family transcriptional regulator [Paenibacillus sp. HW567]
MTHKIDPRISRTRKLLMDAFIKLILKKNFKDITIKDITDAATVNRATLYSHFHDKYDLLDVVINETVIDNTIKNLDYFNKLNQETYVKIFLSLTNLHTETIENSNSSAQCKGSYESFSTIFEQKIKIELENLFYSLLVKQPSNFDSEALKVGAVILSSGIYAASVDWINNGSSSAEQYIEKALPFIVT